MQNEIYRERMMVLVVLDETERNYDKCKGKKKVVKGEEQLWGRSSTCVLACCKFPDFVKVGSIRCGE